MQSQATNTCRRPAPVTRSILETLHEEKLSISPSPLPQVECHILQEPGREHGRILC